MNPAYPLIPILVVILLAYHLTWLFSKWSVFTKQTHRRFWNYLLLVSFLMMGLLSLIAVIKVNYKLTIPIYDQLLRWHVEFGIIMVIISIFHLSWHLKYYFSTSTKSKPLKEIQIDIHPLQELKNSKYLLVLLGTISMINQVIFIREFLSVLDGNEIILGIVMAAWLLITGWGANWGRKNPVEDFQLASAIKKMVFIAIVPAIQIGLLYWLKSELFPPGTVVNVENSLTAVFLLLFPVCFLSGYLFTQLTTSFSQSHKINQISHSYALESIGSLVGGLIFSFILGNYFNSIIIIGITTGFTSIFGTILIWKIYSKLPYLLLLTGALIPVFIFIIKPDKQIKKLFYSNQEILSNQSTRYGNLTITQQSGQFNFYENNVLQYYTDNVTQNEEAVHFAMVQHPNPKRILLLSGGIAGMIREIEKYPVSKITYLESNPEILHYWKNMSDSKINNPNIEIVTSDIRNFLYKTKGLYDVILINLPPPSTLAYNRFYTNEFFNLIKKHCNQKSVICTSLPSTLNYAEQNALEVNASLWKTLGFNFKYRLLIPGEKNWFLVSDAILTPEITRLISERKIETTYVNSYYFDDQLTQQRANDLIEQFKNTVPINQDFKPHMFFRQTSHWLNYMGANYILFILVPVITFILIFFKYKSVAKSVYIAGFTASSLEIILMLAYQVYFGSLYLATAWFFSVFMSGLVLGSWQNQPKNQTINKSDLPVTMFLLALLALIIAISIPAIGKLSSFVSLIQIFIGFSVFMLAYLTGRIFKIASNIKVTDYQQTTGLNYSADLIGSALGVFIVPVYLLPKIGFLYVCLVIAGLNLTIAFYQFFKKDLT